MGVVAIAGYAIDSRRNSQRREAETPRGSFYAGPTNPM
jgi:hypothetical protein